MKLIGSPQETELSPNEPNLLKLIPQDGLLLNHLAANIINTKYLLLSLTQEKLDYRYAIDKWTIKEVVGHLIDMERTYTYRMFVIGRNDKTVLPGFDAHKYVKEANANSRDISDLLEELYFVRKSTIVLLNGLSEEAIMRSGNVAGQQVTVRGLAYHIAGHELHHVSVIKEKYL